jgi:ABC-type polar amino acid transport system ATPase subunit
MTMMVVTTRIRFAKKVGDIVDLHGRERRFYGRLLKPSAIPENRQGTHQDF